MNSWKPSCIKNNDKFKNIPNKMEFTWTKEKKDSIFGSTNKYKLDDTNFPTLGGSKFKEKKKENKVIWDINMNVESKLKSKVKKDIDNDVEGYVWLKNANEVDNNEFKEIIKATEWTKEDSIDEYFDVLHTDTIIDIHESIISYCREKNLPYYDSYDRFYNLINLVKDYSTIYSNMFIEEKHDETIENEEEFIDEEII